MASPAEIAQGLPDTLPADFSDWDSASSPAALPGNSGGSPAAQPSASVPIQSAPRQAVPASFREAVSAPLREPITAPLREAISAPASDRSRPTRSSSSAPALVDDALLQKQKTIGALVDRDHDSVLQKQRMFHELVDRMPASASYRVADEASMASTLPPHAPAGRMRDELAAAVKPQAGLPPFQAFPPELEEEEPERASRKWMIIPAICAIPILGLGVFMYSSYRSGKIQLPKPAAQTEQAVTDTQPQLSLPDTPEPAPSAHNKSLPKTQPATDNQPASAAPAASPTQAQADMMHDQLTAPTRIPEGIKKQDVDTAPPENINTAGADGLAGGSAAAGIPFNSQAKPVVQPVNPKAVSAGVAAGMLIRKPAPVYPPMARTARVSGVVVLDATISKTGAIKDLHVVSGPAMLREAAVDAVRTWRYKPFLLDNQPIEIQTTVKVTFSLDQ